MTISVRERRDADGFGSWTIKDGVLHVQPPADVMSGMLAIRLHLDESGPDNGPLRVIAGSHKQGRLSAAQIASLRKEPAVTDNVRKLVAKISLERCFEKSAWKDFNFFALVQPDDDIFPVRTVYDGVSQNIGNNFLSSVTPLSAHYDLAALSSDEGRPWHFERNRDSNS